MQRKQPLAARNTLENRLWAQLRALEGCRFRRKAPFKTFTLDFVEHQHRLVISLENGEPGRRAKEKAGHIVRDRLLSEQGYVILRLKRMEVEKDLAGALHRIKSVLNDVVAPGDREIPD